MNDFSNATALKLLADMREARHQAADLFSKRRRADRDLYSFCATVMDFALRIRAGQLADAVRVQYADERASDGDGRNRRYLSSKSDEFTLAARYATDRGAGTEAIRATVSRMAKALRIADEAGISPGDLEDFLAKNGGIDALVRNRGATRHIQLTKAVELPSAVGQEFSLRLRVGSGGGFVPLEVRV